MSRGVAQGVGNNLKRPKSNTGLSNKKIGEIFGVSSTAIGKASIRIRNQMSKQKEFKKSRGYS